MFGGSIFEDPTLTLFTYYMLDKQKFGVINSIDDLNFLNRRVELLIMLSDLKETFDYRLFEVNMTKKITKTKTGYSIHDVDLMSGDEFEQFVAKLFDGMGYKTTVTQHSSDFGVDVIAEKDGVKIGIQAKCYSGSVSNSAVQEVAAGMKHYKCDRGMVVTNSTFTKAAIELAKSNSIQLWSRKVLEEKILEAFSEQE